MKLYGVSIRLPSVHMDAKQMIKDILDSRGKISIKTYGAMFSSLADVVHYHIEGVEEPEGYANLDITLTYRTPLIGSDTGVDYLEKTRVLRVLSPLGDNLWTYRMIEKVWESNYPSGVAVDMETHEVLFFNIKATGIELESFSKMTEEEHENFKYEVHDREPYMIKIDENAMFEYIDGAEGLTHLKDNIFIELKCGAPLRLYKKNRNS